MPTMTGSSRDINDGKRRAGTAADGNKYIYKLTFTANFTNNRTQKSTKIGSLHGKNCAKSSGNTNGTAMMTIGSMNTNMQ